MQLAYFDFFGTPAKLFLDEDGQPDRCELYDSASDSFFLRDDLTVDVMSANGSNLISEQDFEQLLARARVHKSRR
jgi:hypothetical protein